MTNILSITGNSEVNVYLRGELGLIGCMLSTDGPLQLTFSYRIMPDLGVMFPSSSVAYAMKWTREAIKRFTNG